jgi:hypothetical protein
MLVVSLKVNLVALDRGHLDDDLIEQYALGRAPAAKIPAIEEHLLVCHRCQDALESTHHYVTAMRSAAMESRSRKVGPNRAARALLGLPRVAWLAGALAATAILITEGLWYSRSHEAAPPAVVMLQSTRGIGNPATPGAPPRKPFTLELDLSGLQPLPAYNLEIVDSDGRSVFKSAAALVNGFARATVRSLKSGAYFVRLYANDAELLREYPLTVSD